MLSMAFFVLTSCANNSTAAGTSTVDVAGATTIASVADTATTAPAAAARPVATAPSATASPTRPSLDTGGPITFAVIGDDGTHGQGERAVVDMLNGWKPDFVINVGDAYYARAGGESTGKYDGSVGLYFCNYLKDVTTIGPACPHGNADVNRFFPTLGNHDYSDAGIENYLTYFNLPGKDFQSSSGNERYYDFTWGPVHFFSINSNTMEPDGTSPDSKQGQWLKKALADSTSAWNIVFFHHPPYSSGADHGDSKWMQWPFKDWGTTAVLSGHEHLYERLLKDGVAYFVNGAGGGDRYSFKTTADSGSQARVAGSYGAQKVVATDKKITFEYYTVDGKLADTYTIQK